MLLFYTRCPCFGHIILKFKNHQRHTTAVRQKSNVLMVPSRALHFPPTSSQAACPHLTVPHTCWPPLSTTNAPGFPLLPMWSALSTWLPPAYHSDHSWESVPFNTLPKVRFWRIHYLFFHFLGFLKEKKKNALSQEAAQGLTQVFLVPYENAHVQDNTRQNRVPQ